MDAVVSLFGGRGRHRQRPAAERAFERAEHKRDDAELRRQQWFGEQRAAYRIRLDAHQAEVEAHNAPWRACVTAEVTAGCSG